MWWSTSVIMWSLIHVVAYFCYNVESNPSGGLLLFEGLKARVDRLNITHFPSLPSSSFQYY